MDKPNKFDITIIGGGMVGLTMAELIAAEFPKARLCLIEQQTFSQTDEIYQPSFDARSTALSNGSAEIFEALGIWQRMLEHAAPILSVHVSDKGHFGKTTFHSSENNNEPLGYVVENAWMGRCLIKALSDYKNIQVSAPARVEKIQLQQNGAQLTITSGSETSKENIFSDLVIIADGSNSSLRESLGIDVDEKKYAQHAVVANLECSESHKGSAFERFTSEGPLALLPQGKDENSKKCALVYTLPEEKLEQTLALSDEEFIEEVQAKFGFRLGKIQKVGKRASYPLSLSIAKEQVRSSLVLMGNAAHFLHPVAGQGFNLALRDVAHLLATLKTTYHLRSNGDTTVRYGELSTLLEYIKFQERDQSLTSLISDSFNQLFSNSNKVKQIGRNVGLLALELNAGVKREVFHRMMGESYRKAPLDLFEENT